MTFYIDESTLISNSIEAEYEIQDPFQRVLATLPTDDPIPHALAMLGILTEQLVPINDDQDNHINIVIDNIDNVPEAALPPTTVKGIQWLLSEVQDTLDADRKARIGMLLDQAQIGSATGSTQQTSTVNSPTDSEESGIESTTSQQDSSDSIKDKGEYTCEFCAAGFATESDLMSHAIHCDERPADTKYKCEYCGNKYISQHAWTNHFDTCNGEPDTPPSTEKVGNAPDEGNRTPTIHECDTCGSTFSTEYSLERHKQSCADPSERAKTGVSGRITEFNTHGGYGFITLVDEEGERDIFFHISEYPGRNPARGERLEFDIKPTDEGPRAISISRSPTDTPEPFDGKFASKRPRWGKDS